MSNNAEIAYLEIADICRWHLRGMRVENVKMGLKPCFLTRETFLAVSIFQFQTRRKTK